MRPPSVYANPSCPAACPCDLLRLLHGPHRVATRLVMILLSQRGWPASAIAELLGCDPATVRRWIHCYNAHGATGLDDRPRPGRPRLGSPRLGRRIRRLLAQPKAWTIGRLYQRLGRPAMSLRTLHRRVAEVACWRRPRLVAKGDPNRDQILADLHQQIRDLPPGAVVVAEDETHINLLPWVRATWIARGQRQHVMTPGKNRRRTIFGAVDLASGQWFYQVTRKAISATFTAFCEQLLAAYSAAPAVAVVCDNVIIHRSKIVQRWLATHPRLLVLHGARYSPHDNPVERIWGALKAWLANNPTLTIQSRIRQVHAFFRERTPEQLLATAAPHSPPWLPDGYTQNHEQAASALVAPAELPVVDLHAGIQPGLHVGRAGQHGLHSGAVTELNQQRAAHPPGAVVRQQGTAQDEPVAVAGLAEPAPLRRLQGLAGRLHARLAATDDQEAPVIAGLSGVVPHRAAQRVAPAAHQHLAVHASPVEGLLEGEHPRCLGIGQVHHMHAAGPRGAVRGQRRPPGDHRLRIAVHERPVGLGQLLQQRLGPRPATAVEEVIHDQACYFPCHLPRPQPRPDPDDRRTRQLAVAPGGSHAELQSGRLGPERIGAYLVLRV